MDTTKDKPPSLNVDLLTFQKMAFIFNAVENGWTVRKNDNKYIFVKNHGGEKEIYLDTYLRSFLEKNFDMNDMINNF